MSKTKGTGAWVDCDQFSALAEQALRILDPIPDASLLSRRDTSTTDAWKAAEKAAGLYGGSFLPIETQSSVIERSRLRYHRLWAATVHQLARLALAQGRFARSIILLSQLVDAAPQDESAVCALIRAQLAAGQRADALLTYQRLAEHLAVTLGAYPSRAAQDLHAAVLTDGVLAH